ncbi:MAG: methionyl-tRNA formyltransferase [Bacilli bacterium]|nr:methionyl-tRNA formyltransferase [Bacilli bacterium]
MKPFQSLNEIRIVYMGTPEISASVLSFLLEKEVNIVAVVSNEDRPKGRKGILEPTPVKSVALKYGIPVYQPHRIKEDYEFLKEIEFDCILTMAYGQIVPEGLLSLAKYGAYNLHGSLLPKYRGAAPMQRAIIDLEEKTGVTLMEMVKEMDAGRMYAKKEIALDETVNYSSLSEKVAKASAELVFENLLDVVNKDNEGERQDEKEVTFAAKITPEEEHLDIDLDVDHLLGYIRGLSLTPGGYFLLEGKKLKVFKAHKVSEESIGEIGEFVPTKKELLLQAKGGVISLDEVQPEGKKPMDARSFLNGAPWIAGKRIN